MIYKDYYKILDLKTSRVSIDEIKVAYRAAAKKYHPDLNVGDSLAEERIKDIDKNMTVAIMGCAVNGPGEAREADIGIAGGKGEGLLFKKGEIVRKIKGDSLVEELLEEINKFEK